MFRMLRPDAHEAGNGPTSRTRVQEEDPPPSASSAAEGSSSRDWFNSNMANVRKNQEQLS
jgi:hypothetical protein